MTPAIPSQAEYQLIAKVAEGLKATTNNQFVKDEMDQLIVFCVQRITQINLGHQEAKQAEANGHDDLEKFSKDVKTVKEWRDNSRGQWAFATIRGSGEILPNLRDAVQALRASGRDGIIAEGYKYTVSDGRDGAIFLNRSRA